MASSAKFALVTGGSSGIGREVALALAGDGWSVLVTARREADLQATVESLKKAGTAGAKFEYVAGDLTKEEDIQALFAAIKEKFGRLDLLFNNAGAASKPYEIEDVPIEDLRFLLEINFIAPFRCSQEAVRIMKAQSPQGGRIINNGSISAYVPRPQSIPYTTSKHAILGLTKCMSLDARPFNIAVSQIDIGNATTALSKDPNALMKQADGEMRTEPRMDVSNVGRSVVFMASLPLDANVYNQTIMATNMPFCGRG